MRSLITRLQDNFGFQRIEEIILIYKGTREKTDELFQSVYVKSVSLANEFGIEKKGSQSCAQEITEH